MEIVCINCPVGCRMTVSMEQGTVKQVTGNQCKRGDRYARQECTHPLRMVTAVLPVVGSREPVSVKTREPIPKELIFACMEALHRQVLTAPIEAGSVVLGNVCGTGVDVVATKRVEICASGV